MTGGMKIAGASTCRVAKTSIHPPPLTRLQALKSNAVERMGRHIYRKQRPGNCFTREPITSFRAFQAHNSHQQNFIRCIQRQELCWWRK